MIILAHLRSLARSLLRLHRRSSNVVGGRAAARGRGTAGRPNQKLSVRSFARSLARSPDSSCLSIDTFRETAVGWIVGRIIGQSHNSPSGPRTSNVRASAAYVCSAGELDRAAAIFAYHWPLVATPSSFCRRNEKWDDKSNTVMHFDLINDN